MYEVINMDSVLERLNKIMQKRTGIDFTEMDELLKDKALLGKELGVAPRDLVMICIDIENEFGIKIPENKIVEGSLKSYKKIEHMLKGLIT